MLDSLSSSSATGACNNQRRTMRLKLWLGALLLGFGSSVLMAAGALRAPTLPSPVLAAAEHAYGSQAVRRLRHWQALVTSQQDALEWHRLLKINHFFNRIPFAEDKDHWGQQDYWATPVEFLSSGRGDCEDYAIGKLFSLYATGVEVEKLRLMHVYSEPLGQAHMVLLYMANPGEHPLVVDNLVDKITAARDRTDLDPLYSFNPRGLWLNERIDRGRKVREYVGSTLWDQLLTRMHKEGVLM
ncbi:transglutaminase-like cysteine peptidase [Microbulbifer sp. MCCC 1A16149]|uniref:transglutaminase-like cysteine peptidase n=1 Tax=Microbulbifer sp. MCCC 1A16149 TaxID=3411322 RepID=UPI003D0C52B9